VKHKDKALTSGSDFISKLFYEQEKLPEFSCDNKFYPRTGRGKHFVVCAEAVLLLIQRKPQISRKQGMGGGLQADKEPSVLVLQQNTTFRAKC